MSVEIISLLAGYTLTAYAGNGTATLQELPLATDGADPEVSYSILSGYTRTVGPYADARRFALTGDGLPRYETAFATGGEQSADDVRLDALELLVAANATPATNAGTKAAVGTITAAETGDSYTHTTTLTLTAFAVGTAADNAALAVGALLYTFPAGTVEIVHAHISVGLTLSADVTTDTPEIGLGTVVGSGANATLGAVGATSENILEGAATADVAGTAKVNGAAPTSGAIVVATGAAHTVYLNAAATWADVTTGTRALTATGTVRLFWRFLGA